jgi:nucleoside-diphosphate-sugar epimerase
MEKILVTGPDGFVGSRLCNRLLQEGFFVRGAQFAPTPLPQGCESFILNENNLLQY